MRILDSYVNDIVKKIKTDTKEKEEVVAEIMDHLLLLKRDYVQKGYDDVDAEKCAIYDFGQSTAIREGLNQTVRFSKKIIRPLCWVAFTVYILTVIKLLFVGTISRILYDDHTRNAWAFSFERGHAGMGINLEPFSTLRRYIFHSDHYNLNIILYNTFGNIALFIPFGLMIPLLFPKMRQWKYFWQLSLITAISLEFLQYITKMGVADIDDVLLYVIGCFIGFAMVTLMSRMRFLNRIMENV